MKYFTMIIMLAAALLLQAGESYMNLYLGSSKIGWYSSQQDTVNDMITVNEKSRIEMEAYGNAVKMDGSFFSVYDMDNRLKKFFAGITSEQMSFFINGYAENDILSVKTILGNQTYEDKLDIKDKIIVFNIESIDSMMYKDNLYFFNPLSRNLEKLKIEQVESEDENLTKYRFSGTTMGTDVYIDSLGVYKSVSMEGITMIRTDTLEDDFDMYDLVNHFMIEAKGNFKGIEKADSAVYVLSSVSGAELNNYRQAFFEDTLKVFRKPMFVPDSLTKPDNVYVSATEELAEKAKKLAPETDEKGLKAIMQYVNKTLKKEIVSGLLSVEEIIRSGRGDCTEHAQVFAAMAIAAGYNADIVSGIVYSKGAFYYHAWNRVLLNGKIYTIDATFNQFEADVSHIEISAGYPPQKVLLSAVQGGISVNRIK